MSPLAGLEVAHITVDLRHPIDLIDLTDRRPGTTRTPPPDRGETAPAAQVQHVIAACVPDDVAALVERWLTANEQDAASRRGPRGRAAHVMGRVAAKQAIQAHLAHAGFAEPAADRIEVANDDRGCPTVSVRGARVATRHLRVTIAHSERVAVAAASLHRPRPGGATATGPRIGIDVEPIEPRSPRFDRLILTPGERELRPSAGDDRDTWLTRLWAAKEAAAKATGRGLEGRPKTFVATAADGERLRIGGRWITTEVVTFAGVDHIVAFTQTDRTECPWHRS